MLDVDGGPDIDAGGEQVFNVLPALWVARARHVGVRQFIDEDECGLSRQRGIEIKLGQRAALVFDLASGKVFEVGDQRGGFGAAVGFDQADDGVDAGCARGLGCCQHRVGFAYTSRGAEVDAEFAAGGLFLAGLKFG